MADLQNLKVVKDCYAAFERGDIPALLGNLDEHIEWYMPGEGKIPQAGSYRGRNEVARFFQLVNESIQFSGFEPREFIEQGDRVIVLGSYEGKAKTTGRSFESIWVMSFTLRNGKIAKFEEYTDTENIAAAFVASTSASA